MRILIAGKLPPPYMGPAIATEIILNSDLKNHFELLHLDTKANKSLDTLGKWNIRKIFKNYIIYFKMFRICISKRPELALIPISQSTTGFLKDSIMVFIAKMTGRKIVLQLRGSNFQNWIDNSSAITGAYVKFILSLANGIIVLGNNLKYLFSNYFPQEKIFVVPNGGNYFLPEPEERKDDKIKILYLANLQPSKGIEDVIDALVMLNKTHFAKFTIDIMGAWRKEETRAYCLETIEKNNLPVTIYSPEMSKHKFRFLSNSDIFVFTPREPEGHPWTIVEAMAAGLPVISTDQGAIIESVKHGVNGFIVEKKNPNQIAEKFRLLIDQPALRKQMAASSRKIYCENFTEEIMVERFTRVFNEVINS